MASTKIPPLTAFQRALLVEIAALGGAKGLAIKSGVEDRYGLKDGAINHGRLYPNLDELVDMGLVTKGTIDDRTNSYQLTKRGWADLEDELRYEAERAGFELRELEEAPAQ